MPTTNNNLPDELAASSDAARLATEPNETYRQNYNRFCRWIDQQDGYDTDEEGRYITRENADLYFSRAIPDFAGQQNTIKTHVWALKWFAYYREYVGSDDFVVENDVVAKGLETQALRRKSAGPDAIGSNPAADPHAGLKDGISEKDRDTIMDYIYSTRNDDGPAAFSHTWGWNAAVRTASSLEVLMSDLNMSYVFGPDDSGSRGRCVLLVLRKGKVHKDRHDSDVQVGTWRHKNPKLCTVFATAKHVITELQVRQNSINFLHEEKAEKKRCPWWDEPLLIHDNWRGTNFILFLLEVRNHYVLTFTVTDPQKACKDILVNTGIRTTKVTHHRTACLQNGGFLGLSPWQLNTLSHHLVEKQFKAYGAVVEKTAAKTLAGFDLGEPYFVARTHLELEEDISYYVNKLLPEYPRWQQERNSRFGDKSSCCDIFLNHLVPYFVEVILQDSIYFINQNRFSRRPFFEMIRNRVPGYDLWAHSARAWCTQKEADRLYDHVPALNDACREAFGSILDKIDVQNQEIASLRTELRAVSLQLSSIVDLLKANGQNHPPQQVEAPLLLQAEKGGSAHGAEAENNDTQDEVEDATDDTPEDGGPPPAPPQERPLTVNDLGQGRMPHFPTRIPKTFLQFLAIWESNGLSEFLRDPMQSPGWQGRQGRAKREAWSKRKYIYRKICAWAEEHLVSLPEAARRMDVERGAETLGNWFKRTHGADQDIARRNRVGLAAPRPAVQITQDSNLSDEDDVAPSPQARAPRRAPPAQPVRPPQQRAAPAFAPNPGNGVVMDGVGIDTNRLPYSHLVMYTPASRPPPRGRGTTGGRGRGQQQRTGTARGAPPRQPPSIANNRQIRHMARQEATQRLRRVEQEVIRAHGAHNSMEALNPGLIARLQAARAEYRREILGGEESAGGPTGTSTSTSRPRETV